MIKKPYLHIFQKGLLTAIGLLALLAAAVAAAFVSVDAFRSAAQLHLFLAVGVLPLILVAMAHFVPVLTRTAPQGGDHRPAAVGLAAGVTAVLGQQFWFPLVYAAALLGIVAGGDLLLNIHRRSRRCLGTPHPGLHWYRAALWFLLAALIAILLSQLWPAQWIALKRLHLHLNLLGFVGLTAYSTLQVLVPTVAGQPDPSTPGRLRRSLPWAIAAAAATGLGAAWYLPLAGVGLAIWAGLTAALLARLARHYRPSLTVHSAVTGMIIALFGWLFNLLFALHHAIAGTGGGRALWVVICGFLLPLISAALSHLIPVTLSPGVETVQRRRCQARLGRYTLARSLLYVLAGALLAVGYGWGLVLAAAGAAWFVGQVTVALVSWEKA